MVSDADRDAEAVIEEILADERPDDGLLAEEGARSDAASGRRWVVDPLDGTTNYLYGFPAWAVSMALEDAGAAAAPWAWCSTRCATSCSPPCAARALA